MDFQSIVCDQSCKRASLRKLFTVVLSAAGHYSFRLLRDVHRVLFKRTFARKDTNRVFFSEEEELCVLLEDK